MTAAFSDSALGSQGSTPSAPITNQARDTSVEDIQMVDAGTEVEEEESGRPGSKLNPGFESSLPDASSSTPLAVHDFQDGPQSYQGSNMDGRDADQIMGTSSSPNASTSQPSGLDVGPPPATSAINRVRKRKGVDQLRPNPDHP